MISKSIMGQEVCSIKGECVYEIPSLPDLETEWERVLFIRIVLELFRRAVDAAHYVIKTKDGRLIATGSKTATGQMSISISEDLVDFSKSTESEEPRFERVRIETSDKIPGSKPPFNPITLSKDSIEEWFSDLKTIINENIDLVTDTQAIAFSDQENNQLMVFGYCLDKLSLMITSKMVEDLCGIFMSETTISIYRKSLNKGN